MRILTCNVRYSAAQDGENSWNFRKDLCLQVVRDQEADLICCQEMSAEQCHDFQTGLPGTDWFGMIDEPGNDTPVNSIFFRRDRFERISGGGYWLSSTPHIPGTKSWQSVCVRLSNWLRLVDRDRGLEFRIVNTHLDHVSQPARENQVRMVLEDGAAYSPEYPQILTGDLNCNQSNPAIQSILAAGWTDTYSAIHGELNSDDTFHAFTGVAPNPTIGKIDWIFVRGRLIPRAAMIVKTQENGRYPSDHFFVSADVSFA